MNEQPTPTKNAAATLIFTTLALSIGYAVLRYHVMGPVPWKDFPFFILNKGLCLAAFLLLTLNFALGPLKSLGVSVAASWLNARKALGMTGFLLVMLHALMSAYNASQLSISEVVPHFRNLCKFCSKRHNESPKSLTFVPSYRLLTKAQGSFARSHFASQNQSWRMLLADLLRVP